MLHKAEAYEFERRSAENTLIEWVVWGMNPGIIKGMRQGNMVIQYSRSFCSFSRSEIFLRIENWLFWISDWWYLLDLCKISLGQDLFFI